MGVFERIVVATDYSDCSHAAVQQAYYLARAAGAELHAVHVIDAPGEYQLIDAYESAIDGEAFQAALLSTSRQLMRESLEELGIRAAEIEPVHLTGNRKADVLIEYAQAVSSNLIVVGTHGRRGLRRILLGSVAQSIVAASQLPVLIAREHAGGRPGKPVRRIMVPVDLSERSLRGLEAAQTLASLYHAQLEIIHVLERYVFPVSLSEVKTVRDLVPDIEARTRKMIRAQVEDLGGPFIPHSIHVREGEPATTIVELADELACDLLVVTRRGLSASARYVVGSVTTKILQAASCSVFVEPAGAPHE